MTHSLGRDSMMTMTAIAPCHGFKYALYGAVYTIICASNYREDEQNMRYRMKRGCWRDESEFARKKYNCMGVSRGRMPNEPLWSTFLPVDHAVWGMTKVRATELQESACLSEG